MILLLVLDVVLVRGKVLLLRRGYLGAGEETHGEDEVGMSSRGRARCRVSRCREDKSKKAQVRANSKDEKEDTVARIAMESGRETEREEE